MVTTLKKKKKPFSNYNKLARVLWNIVWVLLFRPTPRAFHGWRRGLLKLFGANIAPTAKPYPGARIWAPWNLVMEAGSCLADHVDCYCMNVITLREYSTVSQYAFLCTGSHDSTDLALPLTTAPIEIGKHAWITADVFIGPGVSVGEGAVVGVRSSVYKDVEPWTIVVGNPAKFLKKRVIKNPEIGS